VPGNESSVPSGANLSLRVLFPLLGVHNRIFHDDQSFLESFGRCGMSVMSSGPGLRDFFDLRRRSKARIPAFFGFDGRQREKIGGEMPSLAVKASLGIKSL
jgi:hypothetical protein